MQIYHSFKTHGNVSFLPASGGCSCQYEPHVVTSSVEGLSEQIPDDPLPLRYVAV